MLAKLVVSSKMLAKKWDFTHDFSLFCQHFWTYSQFCLQFWTYSLFEAAQRDLLTSTTLNKSLLFKDDLSGVIFLTPKMNTLMNFTIWGQIKKAEIQLITARNSALHFIQLPLHSYLFKIPTRAKSGQVRIWHLGNFSTLFEAEKGPAGLYNLDWILKNKSNKKRQSSSSKKPELCLFVRAQKLGRLVELTRQIFQSKGLSLNRSQYGSCSTKYDTPAGT